MNTLKVISALVKLLTFNLYRQFITPKLLKIISDVMKVCQQRQNTKCLLSVSDIISVRSRVEEGKWVSLEAKDCYSFQCSGSLLSVYTVIEMFLNLCPALFFPFSLFPIPSVCSFHSLFLTLLSTPCSFPTLCFSASFVVVLMLPAELRDSGTIAYLCGNHLLHLSSTAGTNELIAEVCSPL